MDKFILIGGAPGAGKSTLAKKIALARGVNWISTDQIRIIMQKASNSVMNPDLFADANTTKTAEESVAMEVRKARAVWKGVAEFIQNNNPWEGCVIEGSAIMPHLIDQDLKDRQEVLPIFVIQSEEFVNLPFQRTPCLA
jgi:2-phosphoglycerate kinase